MQRQLFHLFSRKISHLRSYSTSSKIVKSLDERISRPALNELCDALWRCRQDASANIESKLTLIDAPRLLMRHRAWSEFVDDGLFGVWAKQMLRNDVLFFVKPPPRLAFIMCEMAKVLKAAISERGEVKGYRMSLSKEDMDTVYRLLDEMIDRVFVKRNGVLFRHASAATEALGRYSDFLNVSPDKVDEWKNTLDLWIRSGQLSKHFSPLLFGNTDVPNTGLTSVTAFLGGLIRLGMTPPEVSLRILAQVSHRLILRNQESDRIFSTSKALIDYARSWHGLRVNPEILCSGSWSAWFSAYGQFLNDVGDLENSNTEKSGSQFSVLIQTALLMAKDFDRMDDFAPHLDITEKTLEKIMKANYLRPLHAGNILKNARKLNEKLKKELMREAIMKKLFDVARGEV